MARYLAGEMTSKEEIAYLIFDLDSSTFRSFP